MIPSPITKFSTGGSGACVLRRPSGVTRLEVEEVDSENGVETLARRDDCLVGYPAFSVSLVGGVIVLFDAQDRMMER
jgi:hypothetical protein